jgi:hypothetical protein
MGWLRACVLRVLLVGWVAAVEHPAPAPSIELFAARVRVAAETGASDAAAAAMSPPPPAASERKHEAGSTVTGV